MKEDKEEKLLRCARNDASSEIMLRLLKDVIASAAKEKKPFLQKQKGQTL